MKLASKLSYLAFGAVAALALATPSARAAEIFVTTLAGANEVPARLSPGTGSGFLSYDANTSILSLATIFFGLTTPTVAAHIHCCGPATGTAGVAIDVPFLPGFPIGVRAGTYNGSFDLLDATNYAPNFLASNGGTAVSARDALLAGLRGGRSYLNIHTQRFPGGELRGQFAAVPEPGTWALALLGFGGVGIAVRRRRSNRAALV
jgi:hypothetical protein